MRITRILPILLIIMSLVFTACSSVESPTISPENTPSPTTTSSSVPAQQLYDLKITVIPPEAGEVLSYPRYGYEHGSQVKLTADSIIGYSFDKWTGDVTGSVNPVTVTMDSDKNITAYFYRQLVFGTVYPVRTTPKYGYVSHIGFTLFNDSSEVITVEEVRVLDSNGHIMFEMSGEHTYQYDWVSIEETWGNRRINSNKSLSASIMLFETLRKSSPSSDSVGVEWICLDANGVQFKVSAYYFVSP